MPATVSKPSRSSSWPGTDSHLAFECLEHPETHLSIEDPHHLGIIAEISNRHRLRNMGDDAAAICDLKRRCRVDTGFAP